MEVANNWNDYEILDMANGEKIERWGNITLIRPDPQIIWKNKSFPNEWKKANAKYTRSNTGGGGWDYQKRLPESWQVKYKNLTFNIKPMGFKHTGLFPEQAVNWDWFSQKIKAANRSVKVLNLFAYTGGATLAAAKAGASVTHVDASKGMVAWAKENAAVSGLSNAPIRWIVDDCFKFVEREIRRGSKYDAIIMDPPSYGRGPKGEIWKIEEALHPFVKLCANLLSDSPCFFLINSYTTGFAPSVLSYLLGIEIASKVKEKGLITADEIGLPVSSNGLILPCGSSGRWESNFS